MVRPARTSTGTGVHKCTPSSDFHIHPKGQPFSTFTFSRSLRFLCFRLSLHGKGNVLFYAPWAPAPEVRQSAAGMFVGVNTKAFNLLGPQENPFIANHFLLFLVGGSPKHTHLCGSLGFFIASRKSFPRDSPTRHRSSSAFGPIRDACLWVSSSALIPKNMAGTLGSTYGSHWSASLHSQWCIMGTLALPVLECLNCVRGDSAPFSPTRVSLSAYIGKIKARLNLRDGPMEIWSALVPWVCKAKPGKASVYGAA